MAGVRNGLYTIETRMEIENGARASGIVVFHEGEIFGGDSYFYYFGTYRVAAGKFIGELTTRQHTHPIGKNLLFGGREVTCGFTGRFEDGSAEVDGTALVGKASVIFRARLQLMVEMGLQSKQVRGDSAMGTNK